MINLSERPRVNKAATAYVIQKMHFCSLSADCLILNVTKDNAKHIPITPPSVRKRFE